MKLRDLLLVARKNIKTLKYKNSTVRSMVLLILPLIIIFWYLLVFAVTDFEMFSDDFITILTIMIIFVAVISFNNFWRIIHYNTKKRQKNMSLMLALGVTSKKIRALYLLELLFILTKATIISLVLAVLFIILFYSITQSGLLEYKYIALFPLAVIIVYSFFSIAISLTGLLASRKLQAYE